MLAYCLPAFGNVVIQTYIQTLFGGCLLRRVSTSDWMRKLHVTFRCSMGLAKICTRQFGQPIKTSVTFGLGPQGCVACLHISVRHLANTNTLILNACTHCSVKFLLLTIDFQCSKERTQRAMKKVVEYRP